jgi:uncharacterized protein YecE (DUF72 family)
MQLWIGTSGFQYPEWKGKFYPATLPASRMLPYYAERFASTESNYSFRQIPSLKTLEKWAAATPERFKFSFKAPQKITHFAKLRGCEDTVRFFHDTVATMGAKLGATLFQLPPTLKKDRDLLAAFLAGLPEGMSAAFEFRHTSWFDDEVFACLREHRAALCIAESADLETPPIVTAEFGYLRLRREDYTSAQIAKWAKFVRARSEWREAFVYFKHEEACVGPKFAEEFKERLGE